MTTLVEEGREISDEARQAVRRLELRPGAPDGLVVLERSSKSTALRATWRHPRRWQVILKACEPASAEFQALAHAEVLSPMPVRSPRLFGMWNDGGTAWLALEDMGDEPPRLEDDRQRAAVSRWVGELHAASRELTDLPPLPERGAPHYAGRLESTRTRLAERRAEVLREGDRRSLTRAIDLCDALRSRWDAVEERAARLSPAFVHADLAPENLRVVRSGGRVEVTAIDWEKAGIGTPFADLQVTDPSTYASAADAPLEAVLSSMWVARLLRALSHNWASKSMRKIDRYGRRIERALGAIDGD